MKLTGTATSHFARKVRILIDHYALEYEFINVGNVAQNDIKAFEGNPLMKVPVLIDEDNMIFDSDHIAQYLVRKFDPEDKYQVLTNDVFDLNVRAIINGAMNEEVKLVLAKRTLVPTEQYSFFQKALDSIKNSLSWLEARASQFTPEKPLYREFHLACLWDHLKIYDVLPLDYPELAKVVEQVSASDIIKRSAPKLVKY